MTVDEFDRDPGMQSERTYLAWRRTLLTAVAVTALSARSWAHTQTTLALASTSVVALCALMATIGLRIRKRRYRADHKDNRAFVPSVLLAMSASISCAALLYLLS
ncbi:MAG: DUF202 domain-containing protein [Rhodococcus sp. (in: high G+C Gram-positive bacteria)]